MKIEASDIEVSKFLKMGIIVIPRFQRPFSWRADNIRDFWNDITNSDEGSYFIGSMVIYSMKQDRFGVVDGQQRLTTITILLCVIRDHLNTRGQDLTLSDLLKNNIGAFIDGNGDIDVLKINWDAITANVTRCGESIKPDSFFVHSWTSRFPAVTKQKAFKAFKARIKEGIDLMGVGSGRAIALSHLRAFKSDSERYLKIYQPTGKFQKFQYVVEESLTALRVFNVEQQTAYVLALLRA